MPNWKKIITSGSSGSLSNLVVDNHVSASLFSGSFYGSGANLTGVQSNVTETATVTDTFTSTTSKSVTHGFGTKNVLVTVYNNSDQQIVPATVTTTDDDTVDVTFDSLTSGRVVIAKGGHIVSGSQPVSEVATVTASFTSTSSIDVSHNFDSKNVLISVYNSTDKQIIPSEITLTDSNNVNVSLDTATSGFVVVAKGGHVVQGTSANSDLLDSQDGTYYLDWNNFNNIPSGLVSGSTTSDFTQLSNNPFTSSAAITASKSLVPSTNNTLDLGSPSLQWRDLYLSSASLYIDGNQVLSSTAETLTISTTLGQSIKLLESGADDIILQTDTGNIELKGTVEVLSGKKIIDSAGTRVLFGDSLGVTGSIDLTGTVDGVDVAQFKTDFDTLNNKSLISSSQQITQDSGIFSGSFNNLSSNPFISGAGSITASGDLVPAQHEVFDLGSPTLRWRDLYLSGSSIFLADTKLSRDTSGNLEVRDSNTNNLKKLRVEELELGQGNSARRIKINNGRFEFTDSSDSKINASDFGLAGAVSSSAQINFNELANIPSGLISGSDQLLKDSGILSGSLITSFNELTNIPSGLISGSDQILKNSTILSGSLITSFNELSNIPTGLVSGSSQIDYNSVSNKPNGLISSSVQILQGSGILSGSQVSNFNELSNIPSGLVSGSSQIDYTGITNKPSGLLSSSIVSIDNSGNLTANTLTETSALRYKENIEDLQDSDFILKLRPVSYDYKLTRKKEYGFIAEEVDEIDPLLVNLDLEGRVEGIKYTRIIPLLVKKVQDQQKAIDELKELIKNGNS